MDDPLKLKIAASLDLPADTAADPEVARAIDADPEARAYARSLHTLDAALRRWPARARDDAAWASLAARIDARVAELPSAAKVKKKKGVSPQEPDFAAAPVFQDDPHPSTESNQPMSEPQDQDADLEGLAALTRTSNVPPSVSIPSVRPALTDEVDDTSSGIVDIKKLAAMARSAESSAPPPPKEEAPKAEAKSEEKKPASKSDDVMVAPSRAAAAVPKVDAPPPTKGGNTWLGMVGGLALAAGAFAIYNSTTRQAADEASAPTAASAPDSPAPANEPAATAPAAPPSVAAPVVAQAPAAPTEAPAPPPAPEAQMGSASAAPTSAPPPAEPAPTAAPAAEAERTADSVVARRESVAAAPAARAAATRAPAGGGGAAAPQRAGAPSAPAQPSPPPAPAARPTPAPAAQPAARPAPAAAGGPAPGSVDEMMRRVTGASAPAPAAAAAAPAAELPERPTRSQITATLTRLNGPVRNCTNGQPGTAPVAIVINGDGTVRSATVSGQFAGTAAGECINDVVRRAHFQSFRAQQVNITYPFVILPPR